MIAVRFHGRAGQGMVTASELLAIAAGMEGKHSQALPVFGSEKRGPPVTSFCRIREKPITIHEIITKPDIVVVADPSILESVDVTAGLDKNGIIIVNTTKTKKELKLNAKHILTIDGTRIALKNLKRPITNTVMLGALVKVTGIIKLESIKMALKEKFANKFSKEMIDANILTIQECYDKMEKQKSIAKVKV